MATSQDYLDFVLEQLLCDNTLFVKKLPVLDEIMANSPCGCPYEGAK